MPNVKYYISNPKQKEFESPHQHSHIAKISFLLILFPARLEVFIFKPQRKPFISTQQSGENTKL